MNSFGKNYKITIFGESHGSAIGTVIDGIPAGTVIDFDEITREMKRRAPGRDKLSTSRIESDEVEVLSGLLNGKATGAPLAIIIKNNNTRSSDYERVFRPSHADYTAYKKYGGFEDYRGGGHFSGRLTANLVFAGSIAKQIIKNKDMSVYGRVFSVGGATTSDKEINIGDFLSIDYNEFPALNTDVDIFKEKILNAKSSGDSVGGSVECVGFGVSVGLGEPFFCSFESCLSSLLFSIPAVKGVEFGIGSQFSHSLGSEVNDEPMLNDNKEIVFRTNNNGGINGGITNGMPIRIRVHIKPTPSISKVQRTVDISENVERELIIKGRHDPFIAARAVPVIEACMAIVIADFIL